MSNPFKAGNYGGCQTYHQTVDDRIRCVRTFSREQCEAALRISNLQKTVERAIRSRLRALDRQEKPA